MFQIKMLSLEITKLEKKYNDDKQQKLESVVAIRDQVGDLYDELCSDTGEYKRSLRADDKKELKQVKDQCIGFIQVLAAKKRELKDIPKVGTDRNKFQSSK